MKTKIKFSPKVTRVTRKLGELIRRSRLRRNLTQDIVAQRAGVSTDSIKRIENGESRVAIGSYLMALHALGILPSELNLDDSVGETLLAQNERVRAPRIKKP